MPDNSIDAVVTDPPYGIEFMGKEWDSFSDNTNSALGKQSPANKNSNNKAFKTRGKPISGWCEKDRQAKYAFQDFCYEWAKECLRVLKPGGYLLAFGGTRTYHRMACAIEDAGFEIRNCIQWIYATGFPKSMDISKAIDKKGGQELGWFIDYILKIAEERNISKKELTMLFPSKNGKPTGWLWNKQKTQGITLEQYNTIKNFLSLPFDTIEEAEREVIGRGKAGLTAGTICNFAGEKEFDITIPASSKAKQWDGWGTALKPAHEPIVVARKPLSEKTVADNVLKWGTGGINIDGCRIEYQSEKDFENAKGGDSGSTKCNIFSANGKKQSEKITLLGRFPANVILDEEAGKLLDEQSGITKSGKVKSNKDAYDGISNTGFLRGISTSNNQHGDSGGASRFFYCAKASKKERGEGNNHPTVKPLSLIKYLITLVTPPEGVCLDPFEGSGTHALACEELGFNYIGFEKEKEYCDISENRIKSKK